MNSRFQLKRNHLICEFMRKSPYVTAKEAQRLADATLNPRGRRKSRKDRIHARRHAKKHSWCKNFSPKDFNQLLKSAGFKDYAEYLESPHWKILRADTVGHHGYCAVCKSLQSPRLHHCNYSRLGHEAPDDIIVLCKYHHDFVHEELNSQYPYFTLIQKVKHSREVLHLRNPGSIQMKKQHKRLQPA